MSNNPHLIIKAGPEKGREIVIPENGARLGRSSENDISLADSLLSRHHCRMEFRANDGLWVIDLESANETLVNDKPITSQRIRPGDTVLLGDSVISVVNDQPASPQSDSCDSLISVTNSQQAPSQSDSGGTPEESSSSTATASPLVDLGFSPDDNELKSRNHGLHPSIWVATIVIGILIVFWLLFRFFVPNNTTELNTKPLVTDDPLLPLQVIYEKVEASGTNIFRYAVEIDRDNRISCKIDSVIDNRHIRKSETVATNNIERLSKLLSKSGFDTLNDHYEGISQSGMTQWSITIITGKNAHHCTVKDQTEPPAFREARETIETFTRSELGLWAIHYSEEQLKKLATDAYFLGRKLYDERDADNRNLFDGITAYREAEHYLETVSPKPAFFSDMLTHAETASSELEKRYKDINFEAQQAMNLGHWPEAAEKLRSLLDLIPDPNDERYKEATRKLLHSESRANQH